MDFNRNDDKNKMDYRPNAIDLGITDHEFMILITQQSDKFEIMENVWMDDNKKRIIKIEKRKASTIRNKVTSLNNHWFNTMDHEKVIELINKTRIKADEAIDAILKTQTKQDFIEYYEKLRQRVKYSNIVIVKASHAKLMRFPNIGGAAGSGLVVFGSNARMVALWSHVFSLRNK